MLQLYACTYCKAADICYANLIGTCLKGACKCMLNDPRYEVLLSLS